MNSFENKKQIRFVITLGYTKFGSSNNNQIVIEGLRATVEVNKLGGMQNSSCVAKIYGVSESDMTAINIIKWDPNEPDDSKSSIEVYAIDGDQVSLVFAGNIVLAVPDYQSQPDVFLSINAAGVYNAMLKSVDPISIKGGARIDAVFEKIANELGLAFKAHNVEGILVDPYYSGDLVSIAKQLAKDANIELAIDDKKLTILQKYSSIPGLEPVISESTGLVGYPVFDGIRVILRCLYNPAIVFKGAIQIESSAPNTSGRWIVDTLGAYLESETPGGAWFSYVMGSTHGQTRQ